MKQLMYAATMVAMMTILFSACDTILKSSSPNGGGGNSGVSSGNSGGGGGNPSGGGGNSGGSSGNPSGGGGNSSGGGGSVNSGSTGVRVESLSLNKSRLIVNADHIETLIPNVLPANATNKYVSWSSNNPEVVMVYNTGKISAVGIGVATITAKTTDGGKIATCRVSVSTSGKAGALNWKINEYGVFAIGGSGIMPNYSVGGSDAPWNKYHRFIKNVTINEGVTSIGTGAFNGYKWLLSVTPMPKSITSIGESAFMSCSALSDVTIGAGVTSIGRSAFYGCTSLKSVAIPNTVTSIGNGAFAYCTGLTKVLIGTGVKSIREYAFSNCTKLVAVFIRTATPPALGEKVFDAHPANNVLSVPTGSAKVGIVPVSYVNIYQQSGWRAYFKNIMAQ
jgi:hypothetical protein